MDLQIEPLKEHAQDIAGSAIGAARAVAEMIGEATESLSSDSKKSSKGTSWLLWVVLTVVAFVAVGSVLFKRKRSTTACRGCRRRRPPAPTPARRRWWADPTTARARRLYSSPTPTC
jgi:hypothetical protein